MLTHASPNLMNHLSIVRACRLPMPVYTGWTTLVVDLASIMENYCVSGNAAMRFKAIRRVQVCSTMLVRDVVVANEDILRGKRTLPKELAVKADSGLNGMMIWDVFDECSPVSSGVKKTTRCSISITQSAGGASASASASREFTSMSHFVTYIYPHGPCSTTLTLMLTVPYFHLCFICSGEVRGGVVDSEHNFYSPCCGNWEPRRARRQRRHR